MSTCVVYYSWHGNNEALANFLSNRMKCGVVRIVESKPRAGLTILFDLLFGRAPAIESIEKSLEAYDHIVLCGPVWAGRLASPLRAFLRLHGQQLREYSFISLCGKDTPQQRASLRAELERRVGRAPRALCELAVSELIPAERSHGLRSVDEYRVEESELRHYEQEIEEFLRTSGALMRRPSSESAAPSSLSSAATL